MPTASEYLRNLIKDHGTLTKVVHSPPSEQCPHGHLLLEFSDDHVEIGSNLYLCREHLERIASVSGLSERKIEWALTKSKLEEFIVWADPHFGSN